MNCYDVILLFLFLCFNFTGSIEAGNAVLDVNRNTNLTNLPSNNTNLARTNVYSKPQNQNKLKHYRNFEPLIVKSKANEKAFPIQHHQIINIHQPREDPRLYYQSDRYLQEVNNRKRDWEVTFIYPGEEVVRAEDFSEPLALCALPDRTICVKCPYDRKLFAKLGSDRVLLQKPRLYTCSGQKPPRGTRFVHKYGPKIGSLLKEGLHTIVGTIVYKNSEIQTCKMQVDVIVQGCPIQKYLKMDCKDHVCRFACKNSRHVLIGPPSLECRDNKWSADLPTCNRARVLCAPPALPEHGQISCSGEIAYQNFAQGSKCRVRCARGWHTGSRRVITCRHGTWTSQLICLPNDL